ncbi:MAG: efflux RND transporter periplasmic adaptor subunit [Acidobacteriota bacterium]
MIRRRLLVLPLLLTLWACGAEAPPPPEPVTADQAVPVVTMTLVPEQVVEEALFVADLAPKRRAVLAAETTGSVVKVTVDDGARVAKERVLVEVDTAALEQRLAEAEAVDRQRVKQLERAHGLFERRSITQQQLLDAVTNRDVAAAQLASAKLELTKARVRAPWSGTVAERLVEVGDYVLPGQPVIELIQVDRLEAIAPVSAIDVPYLAVGTEARIRIDALPTEEFTGTVTRLGSELDSQARTLDVEISIDNRDGRLRPGMGVRVRVPRRTLDGALLVPLAALIELEDGQAVYVAEDGTAVRKEVVTGVVIGENVVLDSGVEAGAQVIVEGQGQLSPGQQIEPVETGGGETT